MISVSSVVFGIVLIMVLLGSLDFPCVVLEAKFVLPFRHPETGRLTGLGHFGGEGFSNLSTCATGNHPRYNGHMDDGRHQTTVNYW